MTQIWKVIFVQITMATCVALTYFSFLQTQNKNTFCHIILKIEKLKKNF